MKKTIFTFLGAMMLMVFLNQAFAQVPQAFNYQAVARNSSGTLLQNQALGVRLSIHQGTAGGTVVYSERQTPTTNQFGLFSVTLGEGTALSGIFSFITWSTGNYWLQVEMDATGGTTYTDMGTSQLLSVPYALYAANSAGSVPAGISGQTLRNDGTNWISNNFLYNNGTNIGIGTITPAELLDLYGGSSYSYQMFHNDATTGAATRGMKIGLRNDGVPFVWSYENQPMYFGTNGAIRMTIAADGLIGIGTTPTSMLDVGGTVTISGANTNELNRAQTGDANLVPIAYGNITNATTGALVTASSTANVTLASHTAGTGYYYYTISGEGISYNSNYVCIATLNGANGEISWNSAGGELAISTYNSAGTSADKPFSFVLYKK
jgi:hypothetical protein